MPDDGWAALWMVWRRCCDACEHFAADGIEWTCDVGGRSVPVLHPGALTDCGDYERRLERG